MGFPGIPPGGGAAGCTNAPLDRKFEFEISSDASSWVLDLQGEMVRMQTGCAPCFACVPRQVWSCMCERGTPSNPLFSSSVGNVEMVPHRRRLWHRGSDET